MKNNPEKLQTLQGVIMTREKIKDNYLYKSLPTDDRFFLNLAQVLVAFIGGQ
jgi:hypothetical protein